MDGAHLTLTGRHLNAGVTSDDYRVSLSIDGEPYEICDELELNETDIRCSLSQKLYQLEQPVQATVNVSITHTTQCNPPLL